MCNYVLFDLDGTLTDPYEGITNSVIYALGKFGINENDRTKLKSFIGPPLYKSFMVNYGFDENTALKAVDYYREYFATDGIFENSVYGGIEEMLSELKGDGKKLIVATSKPQVFAEKILEHFNLAGYFVFVSGASLDNSRIEKSDIIAYAIKTLNIEPSCAVMVGDRKHDIIGAKQNGLISVGVLYGYGDREELKSAGADFIAATPQDIIKVIKCIIKKHS